MNKLYRLQSTTFQFTIGHNTYITRVYNCFNCVNIVKAGICLPSIVFWLYMCKVSKTKLIPIKPPINQLVILHNT